MLITLHVSYQLREYLSVVIDHLPRAHATELKKQGKPLTSISWYVYAYAVCFAAPMFLIKRHRVGK